MKIELLIKILFELLSSKSVKCSYLAQKYEVSQRSIYRYINTLDMAGVPIYTTRGRNGGFAIMDTFKLPSTFMTRSEFKSAIDALTTIAQNVPDKTLESAINKLKSTIKNDYSGFNLQSGNLIIDAGPWGDTIGYKTKLSVVQKSINENKLLLIKYHDRNATPTERTIEPHVIVFKQGLWYVYAYCNLRNEFRFFKIGRIESAQILPTTFTRREFNKADLPLDFWNTSVQAETIIMEIDSRVLSDVEEWIGIENVSTENGKHIAKAKLPYDNGLVSKIISFGSGIKILEPLELKEKVKEVAKDIIDKY